MIGSRNQISSVCEGFAGLSYINFIYHIVIAFHSRHLKAYKAKSPYLRALQGVKTYAICQSYANRCRNEQKLMLWEAAI